RAGIRHPPHPGRVPRSEPHDRQGERESRGCGNHQRCFRRTPPMSENTKLWDMLGRTDPKHTQKFTRGGGFKGTAIKPIWSFRRMTEHFGPCGIGWGVGEPTFQVVPGPEGEMLVYCTTYVWFK